MNEFQAIKLDKDSEVPLYQQLGEALAALIEDGLLKANAKLPPIRKMAEALQVNNVTVVSAYRYLETKKYVYKQVGSGTFVSDLSVELPSPIVVSDTVVKEYSHDHAGCINFANSGTPPSFFPVEQFKGLFNYVLDRDKGNAFAYAESQGYEPLRAAICKYLERYEIKTSADRIQIISGGQQGIDIVSKLMLKMGDIFIAEKPTYCGAVSAFLARGGQAIEVDINHDGIDLEMAESLIKNYRPKFLYLMTYYQTPTCVSYSTEKKRKLLEMATKYDFYIIEEDNLSDFSYFSDPIVPMKALDYRNRVIYIKSFSKILMPGLRFGFMVLPKKIMNKALSIKFVTDNSTSGFFQRVLELYMSGKDFDTHLASMIAIFRKKYLTTIDAMERFLKSYCDWSEPRGGFSIWLEIKNKNIKPSRFYDELLKNNVIVTPGSLFSITGDDTHFFKISFASLEAWDIETGIAKIAMVLANLNSL